MSSSDDSRQVLRRADVCTDEAVAKLIRERDRLTELAALSHWEFGQLSVIEAVRDALDRALIELCGCGR